jgi:hypothetical protein
MGNIARSALACGIKCQRPVRLDGRIQHWMKQGHLSEGHGKLLAGIAYEKQYWYAYYAIKKEWSVSTLDNAIKAGEDKKLAASRARKSVLYHRLKNN